MKMGLCISQTPSSIHRKISDGEGITHLEGDGAWAVRQLLPGRPEAAGWEERGRVRGIDAWNKWQESNEGGGRDLFL